MVKWMTKWNAYPKVGLKVRIKKFWRFGNIWHSAFFWAMLDVFFLSEIFCVQFFFFFFFFFFAPLDSWEQVTKWVLIDKLTQLTFCSQTLCRPDMIQDLNFMVLMVFGAPLTYCLGSILTPMHTYAFFVVFLPIRNGKKSQGKRLNCATFLE